MYYGQTCILHLSDNTKDALNSVNFDFFPVFIVVQLQEMSEMSGND